MSAEQLEGDNEASRGYCLHQWLEPGTTGGNHLELNTEVLSGSAPHISPLILYIFPLLSGSTGDLSALMAYVLLPGAPWFLL